MADKSQTCGLHHSQAGESEKQKSYEVTVRMPAPVTPDILASLNAMRDVLLQQTTPERVAHRRALLVREQNPVGLQKPGVDLTLRFLRHANPLVSTIPKVLLLLHKLHLANTELELCCEIIEAC